MEQLLREALSAYRMDGAGARLLRHNENATYHVESGGREYVLRIHAPRPGFALAMFAVDRHGKSKLEGELSMLDALGGAGFAVQRPVENRAGERVTTLSSGDCATLLTWLEGETVSEVTDDIARNAGGLAARMRLFFSAHDVLSGIDRYAYDEHLIGRLRELLREGGEEGAFGDGLNDIECALDAIASRMAELRARGGEYGLIHADLSKGNLIATENGLAPIDFCLSGRGFFAQDVGGLAADFGDRWRGALLQGYADASGIAVEPRSVDAFVALGVLLYLSSHWKGAKDEGWFPDALERWRRTLFRPLGA